MHITPDPPSMTIARVRELLKQLTEANNPTLVCSFTRIQLADLLEEIDRRIQAPAPGPAAAPQPTLSPAAEFARHRKTCDRCRSGPGERCQIGEQLYAGACAALTDQYRMLI